MATLRNIWDIITDVNTEQGRPETAKTDAVAGSLVSASLADVSGGCQEVLTSVNQSTLQDDDAGGNHACETKEIKTRAKSKSSYIPSLDIIRRRLKLNTKPSTGKSSPKKSKDELSSPNKKQQQKLTSESQRAKWRAWKKRQRQRLKQETENCTERSPDGDEAKDCEEESTSAGEEVNGCLQDQRPSTEQASGDLDAGGDACRLRGTVNGLSCHTKGSRLDTEPAGSHTEGSGSHTEGSGSHTEGSGSHAALPESDAARPVPHAEGSGLRTAPRERHAKGSGSHASRTETHVEGSGSHASQPGTHLKGSGSRASQTETHVEGSGSRASQPETHVEVSGSRASQPETHMEVSGSRASQPKTRTDVSESDTAPAESHTEGSGLCTGHFGLCTGGPESHTDGPGLHTGQSGSSTGEPELHPEGPGLCKGKPGLQTEGSGSHAGEPGSCMSGSKLPIEGSGSHAGDRGSYTGEPGSGMRGSKSPTEGSGSHTGHPGSNPRSLSSSSDVSGSPALRDTSFNGLKCQKSESPHDMVQLEFHLTSADLEFCLKSQTKHQEIKDPAVMKRRKRSRKLLDGLGTRAGDVDGKPGIRKHGTVVNEASIHISVGKQNSGAKQTRQKSCDAESRPVYLSEIQKALFTRGANPEHTVAVLNADTGRNIQPAPVAAPSVVTSGCLVPPASFVPAAAELPPVSVLDHAASTVHGSSAFSAGTLDLSVSGSRLNADLADPDMPLDLSKKDPSKNGAGAISSSNNSDDGDVPLPLDLSLKKPRQVLPPGSSAEVQAAPRRPGAFTDADQNKSNLFKEFCLSPRNSRKVSPVRPHVRGKPVIVSKVIATGQGHPTQSPACLLLGVEPVQTVAPPLVSREAGEPDYSVFSVKNRISNALKRQSTATGSVANQEAASQNVAMATTPTNAPPVGVAMARSADIRLPTHAIVTLPTSVLADDGRTLRTIPTAHVKPSKVTSGPDVHRKSRVDATPVTRSVEIKKILDRPLKLNTDLASLVATTDASSQGDGQTMPVLSPHQPDRTVAIPPKSDYGLDLSPPPPALVRQASLSPTGSTAAKTPDVEIADEAPAEKTRPTKAPDAVTSAASTSTSAPKDPESWSSSIFRLPPAKAGATRSYLSQHVAFTFSPSKPSRPEADIKRTKFYSSVFGTRQSLDVHSPAEMKVAASSGKNAMDSAFPDIRFTSDWKQDMIRYKIQTLRIPPKLVRLPKETPANFMRDVGRITRARTELKRAYTFEPDDAPAGRGRDRKADRVKAKRARRPSGDGAHGGSPDLELVTLTRDRVVSALSTLVVLSAPDRSVARPDGRQPRPEAAPLVAAIPGSDLAERSPPTPAADAETGSPQAEHRRKAEKTKARKAEPRKPDGTQTRIPSTSTTTTSTSAPPTTRRSSRSSTSPRRFSPDGQADRRASDSGSSSMPKHSTQFTKPAQLPKSSQPFKSSQSSKSSSAADRTSAEVKVGATGAGDGRADAERANRARKRKRRSLLDELANTEGYVAEKRLERSSESLLVDPSQLSREERALQRAIMKFSEMEFLRKTRHNADRKSALKSSSRKKAGELKKKAINRRKAAGPNPKHKFEDFKPIVLTARTRLQASSFDVNKKPTEAEKTRARNRKRRQAKRNASAERRRRDESSARTEPTTAEGQTGLGSSRKRRRKADWSGCFLFSDRGRKRARSRTVKNRHGLFVSGDKISARKAIFEPAQTDDVSGVEACPPANNKESSLGAAVDLVTCSSGCQAEDDAVPLSSQGYFNKHNIPPEVKRLNVCRETGETVLHKAARMGYVDIVLWCCKTNYVDVNARDYAGFSALHETCVSESVPTARCLLEHGADVNVASRLDGVRPLHDAIERGHFGLVRLLLSWGADPTLSTYSGRTALKIARTKQMRDFLMAYFVDLNGAFHLDLETRWELPCDVPGFWSEDCPYSDIFAGLPSDDDSTEPDKVIFEMSEVSPPPCYYLILDKGTRPHNYVLLEELLSRLQLTEECLRGADRGLVVESRRLADIEGPGLLDLSRTCSGQGQVRLVRYDDRVRELLGVESVVLEGGLSACGNASTTSTASTTAASNNNYGGVCAAARQLEKAAVGPQLLAPVDRSRLFYSGEPAPAHGGSCVAAAAAAAAGDDDRKLLMMFLSDRSAVGRPARLDVGPTPDALVLPPVVGQVKAAGRPAGLLCLLPDDVPDHVTGYADSCEGGSVGEDQEEADGDCGLKISQVCSLSESAAKEAFGSDLDIA